MEPGFFPDEVHVHSHQQSQNQHREALLHSFADFIRNFHKDDLPNEFPYRDELVRVVETHQSSNAALIISVVIEDLQTWENELVLFIEREPEEAVSLISQACNLVLKEDTNHGINEDLPIQISLSTKGSITLSVRQLSVDRVDTLVHVAGIISHISRPRIVGRLLKARCRSCQAVITIPVAPGLSKFSLPPTCTAGNNQGENGQGAQCAKNPFEIVFETSSFIDQKIIRIQEPPETAPTGDLPRSITVCLDANLSGRPTPGARVAVVGVLTTHSGATEAVRIPYIRALGIKMLEEEENTTASIAENRSKFIEFSRLGFQRVYSDIVDSIAPEIYGHGDLKAAVACALFGGCAKVTKDDMRIRGDINVLLMGDPGTAKSQLLRRASQLAPRAILTSGRGASAAGLTAAVSRDPATGGFFLEGGALVLADGGLCCIDEFDKVSHNDRVAIHEAMEQQTISISKAGITTMLSSRTAVLAAANPTFGRWDDFKNFDENIDLQSTILSRFDLIFLIKDTLREDTDKKLARHVLKVHRGRRGFSIADDESFDVNSGILSPQFLKPYIQFAKTYTPKLTIEAMEKLRLEYVQFRESTRSGTNLSSAIPITIRQLEAIIRIAEALARMELSSTVNMEHCDEALRLFRESTLAAAQKGVGIEGMSSGEISSKIKDAVALIKHRVPVGAVVKVTTLITDFERFDFSKRVLFSAIQNLARKGDFEYRKLRKFVERIR
ncbi:hypothetical protein GEMRC1_010490 [Eukaryota sp. GEM-RC1]